jgi:hypothetical protein
MSDSIKFLSTDLNKQMFNRALNACFLCWDPCIVEFLYRFIRSLILNTDSFSLFKCEYPVGVVYAEFRHQFKLEFGFDSTMRMNTSDHFDVAQEWNAISPLIARLEFQHPILVHWLRY